MVETIRGSVGVYYLFLVLDGVSFSESLHNMMELRSSLPNSSLARIPFHPGLTIRQLAWCILLPGIFFPGLAAPFWGECGVMGVRVSTDLSLDQGRVAIGP